MPAPNRFASFVLFLLLAIQPFPLFATTSQELVESLGMQPFVSDHSLRVGTGASWPPVYLDPSVAVAAGTFPDERAILLSSGRAADRGFGSTDWNGDGERDFTSFRMKINIPPGAKTLVFSTQFTTSEADRSGASVNDYVTLQFSWPCPPGVIGCMTAPLTLDSVSEVPDKVNPFVRRYIRVEGREWVEVSFAVSDRVDGLYDSALMLKHMYLSEIEMPGNANYAHELPSEDVKLSVGSYRYQKNLMHVPGNGIPIDLTLYYNARQTWTGSFARKWSHSYAWSLHELDDGVIQIRGGDGGSLYFSPQGPNLYVNINDAVLSSFPTSWNGVSGSIQKHADGTYSYSDRELSTFQFSVNGLLTAISDSNENRLYFSYDTDDQLIAIEDTRGQSAILTYSTDGHKRLLAVVYNGQLESFFTYKSSTDDFGNPVYDLATITNATGRLTTFTYDHRGNLLTGIDADGVVFIDNAYTGETLVARADGLGVVDTYVYYPEAMEHTDRSGFGNLYTYDIHDRLTSTLNPAGHLWRYFYDDRGNLTREIDPLGHESSAVFDDRGNPVSQTDPLGNTYLMTYDQRNNLLSHTNPLGWTIAYRYDNANNLVEETNSLNHSVHYDYNAAGLVTRVTDRKGNQTRYTYSATGDLTEEIDPLGHRVSYDFDTLGRMHTLTDENGQITTYSYDADGRLLSLRDPLGHQTTYTYNARGQRLSVALSNGAVNRYAYNDNGQMTLVTDPLGNAFLSDYDVMDRLFRQTDPLGRQTTFGYDLGGRMTRVEDASGGVTTIAYDAAGNRTRITDPNGNSTDYTVDALGRVTAETSALGHTSINLFNQSGLLVRTTNARGIPYNLYYDSAGQPVAMGDSSSDIQHQYDANRNPIISYGNGWSIVREYDSLDRLVNRTDAFGNTIGYRYDPVGNLAQLIYSDGKSVHYTYDERNRLIEVEDWEGNATAYTYDAVGNLVSITRPNGTRLTNRYDLARQLVAVSDSHSNGETIYKADFAYNAVGLRTAARQTLPLEPEYVAASHRFSYDADNQIVRMNDQDFAYDPDGNMTLGMVGGVMTSLEYDKQNRLTKVGGHAYSYDVEGLRTQSEGGGLPRRYVQDTNAPYSRLLEEQDGDGNIIARYVYGIGVISRSESAGALSFYHFDSIGSTIALTDATGYIKDAYAYDSYGKVVGRSGNTDNPFTFIGRDGVFTDETGLYFMRARYYEPELMRFIQKDQVFSGNLMTPQSLNRHAYVKGNPVQFVDPSGELCPCAVIAIGAAVGVGTHMAFDWATGEFNPLEDNWGAYLENNWMDLTFSAVTGALGGGVVSKTFKAIKHAKKMKKIKDYYKKAGMLTKSINQWSKVNRAIKYMNISAASVAATSAWEGIKSFAEEKVFEKIKETEAYQAVADWTVTAAKDVGSAIEGVWSSTKKTVRKLKFW